MKLYSMSIYLPMMANHELHIKRLSTKIEQPFFTFIEKGYFLY